MTTALGAITASTSSGRSRAFAGAVGVTSRDGVGVVAALALPPPFGPGPGRNHRLLLALLAVTALLLTVLPGSVGHAAAVKGRGVRDAAGGGVVNAGGAGADVGPGAGAGPGSGPGPGPGRVWPVGGPGALIKRFEAPAKAWAAGHRGVDLAAGGGADIRSAAPGVISFSGLVAGRPVVTVTHPASGTPPLRTTYLPVSGTLTVGTTVLAGEVIGQLTPGAAHCAGRDCLHWGLLRGDRYLDPLALFGAGTARLLPLGRGR
ncbi:M23 family metallopeptidase [Kitasatospora sp. NPDC050463]|uniref:M23 family metallopeptidase n=1 Tax=Kitasatospora sp. NPDC050463 TaxID=3155786 RepID=UPI0033EDDC4A